MKRPMGINWFRCPATVPSKRSASYLSETEQLELLEIGCQKEISVDLLAQKGSAYSCNRGSEEGV